MKRLIDTACPDCGHVQRDVWVDNLQAIALNCHKCGGAVERAWAFVKAPGITPQGTRVEINTDPPSRPAKVDTQAIALETKREIEDKWLRYSDEKVAEANVSREINHKAGICDVAGNETPLPKQDPIVFEKPSLAECAI
jgi:hypothetical protein